jgi:hypothetical protein
MSTIEQQLTELGAALDVPATPDLMSGVSGRLERRRSSRRQLPRLTQRRPIAIAIVLALLLVGTAAAVPALRHAVERVFGLDGVVVQRVPRLPPVPKQHGNALVFGRRIPVADAAHATSFRALLPPSGIDAAYVATKPPGGRLTLVIGRSLLMEFRGQSFPFIEKLIGTGTRARRVRVDGGRGVWLSGAPHEVLFMNERGVVQTDTVRLEGNVLIWQHGRLILRIEGASSLPAALALAKSLR